MIPLPTSLKIIDKKDNYTQFKIEGLYPGYGITLGNTLRRVLLSSLEGAAIVQVKIKGVQHEFSTIPGVLEDVISIILNLKKLRFKFYGEEPQEGTIKVKGERKVRGEDLQLPSQVKVVNKDQLIATLTDKRAALEMEVTIKKGIGYEPVELRKEGKLEIGQIPIDAIYTPVRRVNFRVEKMRVGERIDFDRLILDLETDGTISPTEALSDGLDIIQKHVNFLQTSLPSTNISGKSIKSESEILISNLGLSSKVTNALSDSKIKTLTDLVKKSEDDIKKIKGIGEKGIEEIRKVLKKRGFNLKS